MRIAIWAVVLWATAMPACAESGLASHYSTRDHDQNGSKVACPGRTLVNSGMTAAHRTLPCGARVTVINNRNGRSAEVTITDRGPFVRGRIIDVTTGVAHRLGFSGLTHVTLRRE